jgi:hypothetical protein
MYVLFFVRCRSFALTFFFCFKVKGSIYYHKEKRQSKTDNKLDMNLSALGNTYTTTVLLKAQRLTTHAQDSADTRQVEIDAQRGRLLTQLTPVEVRAVVVELIEVLQVQRVVKQDVRLGRLHASSAQSPCAISTKECHQTVVPIRGGAATEFVAGEGMK